MARNGFSVRYLEQPASSYLVNEKVERLCSSIKISNVVELEELTGRLLAVLEAESRRADPDRQKVLTIDLEKVTRNYQEIAEKHMVITLCS